MKTGLVKIGITKENKCFYAEKYDETGPIFRQGARLTHERAGIDAITWAKKEFGPGYKDHLDLGIFYSQR